MGARVSIAQTDQGCGGRVSIAQSARLWRLRLSIAQTEPVQGCGGRVSIVQTTPCKAVRAVSPLHKKSLHKAVRAESFSIAQNRSSVQSKTGVIHCLESQSQQSLRNEMRDGSKTGNQVTFLAHLSPQWSSPGPWHTALLRTNRGHVPPLRNQLQDPRPQC